MGDWISFLECMCVCALLDRVVVRIGLFFLKRGVAVRPPIILKIECLRFAAPGVHLFSLHDHHIYLLDSTEVKMIRLGDRCGLTARIVTEERVRVRNIEFTCVGLR